MTCPKCGNTLLEPAPHNRWRCPYVYPNEYKLMKDGSVKEVTGQPCGFACGLAFFFDDENVDMKSEVGIPIGESDISPRAQQIIQSKFLSLGEIDRFDQAPKLNEVKEAEDKEEEWNELNSMMREVVGRSVSIHRTQGSGEAYRKIVGGGLLSRRLG